MSVTFHTLDECAFLVQDSIHPRDAKGMPYIGLEHIEEGALHLKGHGWAEDVTSAKSEFKKGDILFGKLRPYFRKAVIAPFDGVCSTDIWVVRAKPCMIQDYVFYWMASEDFVNFANSGSIGTRMPRAKWEHASRHKQRKRSADEQRAIARILGTLDDKIETNRKMNTTLESIAQTLFQSWFIDFTPVHAKSKGHTPGLPPQIADLFPSEFEDSKLGKIPSGWRFLLLSEVAKIVMGQSPLGSTYNESNIGLPFYQGVADFQDRYPKKRVFCTAPTQFANKGDILLSVRAPIGRINVAIERCAIGRGLASICASNPENQGFLDIALRQKSNDWRILESQGSVFGSAKKSDISNLPILWPTPEIRRIFSSIANVLSERIEYNFQVNCALTNLRDALLPKLLSGELWVKAAG